MPWRCADGSTPIPARYQCGPETVSARICSTARPYARNWPVAVPSLNGVDASAFSVAAIRIGGLPGGSQRAAAEHRPRRRVDVGGGDVEADPEEPRQQPLAPVGVRDQPDPRRVVQKRAREHVARVAEPITADSHDLHARDVNRHSRNVVQRSRTTFEGT